MLAYRPKGFASAYGRTSPWEDKAEVLAFAVRGRLLPQLYKNLSADEVDKAYRRLAGIRKNDPVFARKIESLAILFGNLERPENRNSRLTQTYDNLTVHFASVDK